MKVTTFRDPRTDLGVRRNDDGISVSQRFTPPLRAANRYSRAYSATGRCGRPEHLFSSPAEAGEAKRCALLPRDVVLPLRCVHVKPSSGDPISIYSPGGMGVGLPPAVRMYRRRRLADKYRPIPLEPCLAPPACVRPRRNRVCSARRLTFGF